MVKFSFVMILGFLLSACSFSLAGEGGEDPPAQEELQTCSDKKSETSQVVSIDIPRMDAILEKIKNWVTKIPAITRFEVVPKGKVSYESTEICCDENSSDDPVVQRKYSGSTEVEIKIEFAIVGGGTEFTFNPKSKVHCYVFGEIKTGIFITPSGSGKAVISGEESECETCISVTLDGNINLAVSAEFKLHALAQVFERGKWYSLDGEVLAQAKAEAGSGIEFGGGYKWGNNCQDPGATGKFDLKPLTIGVELECKVAGFIKGKYRKLLAFSYGFSYPVW